MYGIVAHGRVDTYNYAFDSIGGDSRLIVEQLIIAHSHPLIFIALLKPSQHESNS